MKIRSRTRSFWFRYALVWMIAPSLMPTVHAIDHPVISLSVNIDDESEIRVNRNLIQWQSARFLVQFSDSGGYVDLTDGSAKLTCKTIANVEAGATNTVFEVSGVVSNAPSGLAYYDVPKDYIDETGKLRFEFSVLNDTNEVGIRAYSDIYVVPGTYIGGSSPWEAPNPSTNYYTKAEVDALFTNVAYESSNNTFISGTTNTFSGVLRSEYLYGDDNYDQHVKLYNGGVDVYGDEINLTPTAGDVNVVGANLTIDGDLNIGTTASGGYWNDDGSLWTKGANSRFVLSEQGDAADYVLQQVASGQYYMGAVDVTAANFFYLNPTPVTTVRFFGNDVGAATGPVLQICSPDGTGAGNNAWQFGRSTTIDYPTLTSAGSAPEPMVFGDGTPSEDIATTGGEVIFTEDVDFDASVHIETALLLNGDITDESGEVVINDNLSVSNATATVTIEALGATYPELSLVSNGAEEMELKAASNTFTLSDNVGQYIQFQTDSEEEIYIAGGESQDAILRIGDDGTAPIHVDSGDVQIDEDLTVSGDFTMNAASAKTATLGNNVGMKLQGYGMIVNALNTDGAPYYVDFGTGTVGGGGTTTEAFTVTFGAAPVVLVSYSETGAADFISASSVTTTNCLITGDAGLDYSWLAIGEK